MSCEIQKIVKNMLDLDIVKMEKFVCLCVIVLIGCIESGRSNIYMYSTPGRDTIMDAKLFLILGLKS